MYAVSQGKVSPLMGRFSYSTQFGWYIIALLYTIANTLLLCENANIGVQINNVIEVGMKKITSYGA